MRNYIAVAGVLGYTTAVLYQCGLVWSSRIQRKIQRTITEQNKQYSRSNPLRKGQIKGVIEVMFCVLQQIHQYDQPSSGNSLPSWFWDQYGPQILDEMDFLSSLHPQLDFQACGIVSPIPDPPLCMYHYIGAASTLQCNQHLTANTDQFDLLFHPCI